jgi:hypothetical protein
MIAVLNDEVYFLSTSRVHDNPLTLYLVHSAPMTSWHRSNTKESDLCSGIEQILIRPKTGEKDDSKCRLRQEHNRRLIRLAHPGEEISSMDQVSKDIIVIVRDDLRTTTEG